MHKSPRLRTASRIFATLVGALAAAWLTFAPSVAAASTGSTHHATATGSTATADHGSGRAHCGAGTTHPTCHDVALAGAGDPSAFAPGPAISFALRPMPIIAGYRTVLLGEKRDTLLLTRRLRI